MASVVEWRTLPAQPAAWAPIPAELHPTVIRALHARGIAQLYSHQAEAVEHALAGRSVAVVTPTASGKTLCYNLPVLHALLAAPQGRALYLFPTKALAQDQLAELRRWSGALQDAAPAALRPVAQTIFPATYDGDTPAPDRTRIRKTARLVLTNPDMLHVGILPYHTQWAEFLAGLRWVVIDEMHTYRGVFGSHVAGVLRRLLRLCAHYGSRPQFVLTSATIANPQELAERLIEQPVALVEGNGAPRGEKHVILVNPPLVDAERGLRRAATLETADLAVACVQAGVQTIVFGRSRLTTELLLTYLRDRLGRPQRRAAAQEWRAADSPASFGESASSSDAPRRSSIREPQSAIRGYRGGYLPAERRAIEAGLRSGEVRAVVATNALELGIDIGQLQAAILCGYPGSIASAWQQMGRAGRTTAGALALFVATAGALDQYLLQHAEFLFARSPERALLNPDNLALLMDHVRCAAFELPFHEDEQLGGCPVTGEVLQVLAEEGDLHRHGGVYFWNGESYPARRVSLRSAGGDAVVIQTVGGGPTGPPAVIGEVDVASAPILVHDGAIYLHEGQSYRVERLDLEQRCADVVPVAVDFYTTALSETDVQVLAVHETRTTAHTAAAFGDVTVTSQVTSYRRIKRQTHEHLGTQPLAYPPFVVETSAYWLEVLPAAQAELERAGLWYDSINDYGPNWAEQRARVRARDRCRCTRCGAAEPPGREHDVHHLVPFRVFGYVRGLNENYVQANQLDNLVLVCRSCHQRIETATSLRSGLDGLAYALINLAPLHLMCDPRDLGIFVARGTPIGALAPAPVAAPVPTADVDFLGSAANVTPALSAGSPQAGQSPRLYLFERTPAGLGFSAALYDLHEELLEDARRLIAGCGCTQGCPACVGPVLEEQAWQLPTKALTLGLLRVATGQT